MIDTETLTLRRAGLLLTVTSFIVLFQELAFIRWVSGQVRVLAYFPNVVLISAFLGLGVGAMRARKPSLLWLWPLSVAVLTATTLIMSRIAFTNVSASEHLWLLYMDIPNAPVIRDVRPPIVIVFLLSTISFIPLGQLVGALLRRFTGGGATLWGYVADLSGSLIGVIGFALASFFRTFPIVWFGVFLTAGMILFIPRGWRAVAAYAALAIAVVAVVGHYERAYRYSPYYALRYAKSDVGDGVDILANGSLHQYAAPLGKDDHPSGSADTTLRTGYPLPYQALGYVPHRVLILGAGTGNDVITALNNGAEEVDAVEIDPVILEFGRQIHPDHPYSSARVHTYNTDAREYLRNTTRTYDLIIFGTLDSMTRLSALSNVRLDNFVYTVDCMRAARAHLTPRGGVALYFMTANRFIHDKLAAMLTRAFDQPPLIHHKAERMFNEIYLDGPAWNHLQPPPSPLRDEYMEQVAGLTNVPTDDWPYLYLDTRTPSSFYLSLIVLFLAITVGAIWIAAPEMRSGLARHADVEMFLFGAAFLLLETKLVTQMALVWGTTWVTSAVVFGAILITILAGTIAMQVQPIPYPAAAAGLVLSLLASYFIPLDALIVPGIAARLACSILFAGIPIAFSSTCFAIRFRTRADSNLAFGWNLAGAVFGGLTEFLSMITGIRAMTLVALVAYLVAFLVAYRATAAPLRAAEA